MSDVKEKLKTFALIMAGGKGTRFWPESTERKPKQYLNLLGEKSLLKQTIDRLEGFTDSKNAFVVTVKDQEGLIKKDMEGKLPASNIVFEPSGRNTAPCILLSLAELLEKGASLDDVVTIMPSDHVILNERGFRATLEKATYQSTKHSSIVVIGIQPHFPHTGYGYIEKGEKKEDESLIGVLLSLMHNHKADYTNTFYSLMNNETKKDKMFQSNEFIKWNANWNKRLEKNNKSHEESLKLMYLNNPLVIPRNHKVEEALKAANNQDLKPMLKLLQVLEKPYEKQKAINDYQSPPPASDKKYQTFCGT